MSFFRWSGCRRSDGPKLQVRGRIRTLKDAMMPKSLLLLVFCCRVLSLFVAFVEPCMGLYKLFNYANVF